MASFYLDDYRLISVRKAELALNENLKLLVNNIEVKFNISDDADYVYLHLEEDFNEKNRYMVLLDGIPFEIKFRFIVQTERFDEEYRVDLNTLGSFVEGNKTTFRLWSPLSKTAILHLDNVIHKMNYVGRGVFELTFDRNLSGHFYHYSTLRESVYAFTDPFSYADKDHKNSYVVDRNKLKYDKVALKHIDTPIIYETSVRDFTSDSVSFKYPQTFKGMCEQGAKLDAYPVGFDYLKKLGITYVQLMPIFAFDLDHSDYNWGYNPLTYNSLHQAYCYGKEPYEQIKELRDFISLCHKYGMGVTFDVVFNHVYNVKSFNLANMLPYYFFRYKDGKLGNASYCGNEVRTEAFFTREYLKLLVKRFIDIYDLDGYRFDLMGILDAETIEAIRDTARELKPDFLMYGEGWNMGDIVPFEYRAIKENAYKLDGVAFFNDDFRRTIRGNYIDDKNAYMLGYVDARDRVKRVLSGSYEYGLNINQTINYIECHDNYTVYDKVSRFFDDEKMVTRICKLSMALVMISRGIPFINSGEEFLRTKHGIDNTYNLDDSINMLDWHRKNKYLDVVEYFSDLCLLRKTYKEFTKENVDIEFVDYYEVLIYKLGDLTIYINPCIFDHVYNDEMEHEVIFDDSGFVNYKRSVLKIKAFSILITK